MLPDISHPGRYMFNNFKNITKSKFKDDRGRLYTVSLFLEIKYKGDTALYTLDEYDREYEGKTYPSIKQLYLEMEDPTEYEFAKKYFFSWQHWLKICANKQLRENYINAWREELEIKLRSQGIKKMVLKSGSDTRESMQASKWLAERGWDKRRAGTPSKAEVARETKIQAGINSEIDTDYERLKLVVKNDKN